MKNKIIRRLALLVSLVMLLTSTVNTTYGFIVTKTESLVNTFTPFSSPIGDLLISKSVEHPFGTEYVIPDHIAFDYKVELGSLYANTTVRTTAGNVVADATGAIRVSVKPGRGFAIEGIDAGTKVTVTELQTAGSGFAVKDGVVTKEGTVAEDGSLKFEYTNVYTPAAVQPVNVSVTGTKTLQGRPWQQGDSFSFKLEQKSGSSGWETLGTKKVTYDANDPTFNHFDFSDLVQTLTFQKVGTYQFRMTEVAGNLENVDYDTSVNTFTIRVTDVDMDGKLEINSVTAAQNATVNEANGAYTVAVHFNNTFTPALPDPEDIKVKISVDKTVKNTGASSIGPAGFEFVLEDTASHEKLTVKTDKNGKAEFSLPFTAADIGKVFTYRLTETDDGRTGVTYDPKVYNFKVSISLGADNKLAAKVQMNGRVTQNATAAFENIYHTELPTPEDTSTVIWVQKTVKNTGSLKLGPKNFEFVLTSVDTGDRLTRKTDDEGKTAYTLTFTAEDIGETYTYQLSEVDTGKSGVTYDTKVYEISVAVTLGADNKLVTTVTLDGKTVTKPVAKFVNTYYAKDPDVPKTGDNSHLEFWIAMMAVSAAACVALIILDRNYRKKEHE